MLDTSQLERAMLSGCPQSLVSDHVETHHMPLDGDALGVEPGLSGEASEPATISLTSLSGSAQPR